MGLLRFLERNAFASPDALAIACAGRRINYAQLNCQADLIAQGLRDAGVTGGCLVGVLLDRSPEMVAGLLGIWKAGAAYVALDPAASADQISFVLEDAAPPFVLTRKKFFARIPESPLRNPRLLDLDDVRARKSPSGYVSITITEEDLAYVIYTSGSTGKPKGASITHGGLLNTVLAVGQDLRLAPDDIVLAWSTIAFDVACLEIYLPLAFGASLYLVENEVGGDGDLRLEQIRTSAATVMMGTPTMYRILLEKGWQGDTRMQVVVGGEVLPLHLGTRLARMCRTAWNQYGPSETAICATRTRIEVDAERITIGHPLPNVSVHLLDQQLQPVAMGSMGEMYIGGAGVALGYLNRPDLNQARFLSDPFSSGRLFKSGDLAIELPDGSFDFLGRTDNQVKVRGCRVELGEIESALTRCEGLHAAVVRAIEFDEGDRRLIAFVIGEEIFQSQWKQSLQRQLPHYMVPSEYVSLPSFPTTPGGKVDVRALDAMRLHAPVSLPASEPIPADPVEARLKEVWQTLLRVNTVGLDQDFFASGGHSLLAARMLGQVEQWFGSKLPHSVLVEQPTIRGLAAYLRQSPAGNWPALVTIQAGAFLPPLFIAHGLGGSLLSFIELAGALGPEQPVYGLQLPAFIDEHQADLRILAANYVKQLRAVQPAGPYHLAGHSSGGLVVFEMACQIIDQGETVGLLALLDCDPHIGKVPHRPFKDWNTFKDSFRRVLAQLKAGESGMKEWLARRTMHHTIKIRSWLAERLRHLGIFRRWLPDSVRASLLGTEGYLVLAIRDHQLRPYPGNATLFIAQDEPRSDTEPAIAWSGNILGVCETQMIPGTHQSILARPQVISLAREIRQRLARHVQSSAIGAATRSGHEMESFTKLKHVSLICSCTVATAPIMPSDGNKSCSLHG
ncbi:MAG: amino acid adenylation domain-containing protein [Acidobacteriaceae bacterium]